MCLAVGGGFVVIGGWTSFGFGGVVVCCASWVWVFRVGLV